VPEATLRNVSGSHTMEGIFFATGAPFRKDTRLDTVTLGDILPTALHLAGVAIPDDIDGAVLADALAPEYLASHPVATTAVRAGDGDDGDALSAGEEQEMRKFLQDLGYIE
jgi:arylsulfatase A-like enzyme